MARRMRDRERHARGHHRRLVRDGVVEAVDGSLASVQAQSICVHGDSPGAVAMARAVRAALEADGIAVRPFV